MKILIIGGSSLLGRYLYRTKPSEHDLSQTCYRNIAVSSIWHKLDIRSKPDVAQLFEIVKPDYVIHCAAIGSVDYAEQNYAEVADVNVNGLKNVIDAANNHNAPVMYISSNAVFDGKNPPYNETSATNAINAYGIIKRQAERIVQDSANEWVIIRPFLLYGWPYPGGRTNWAKSIIEKVSAERGGYKLVNDHIWQPTYAGDLAESIWDLLFPAGEIYNIAAPERATLYEFGLKVCDAFGLEKCLIQPISSDYFPKIAKRPHNTSYDLSKIKEAGIVLSDIRTGLEKMRNEKE